MSEAEDRPLLGDRPAPPATSLRQRIDRARRKSRRWYDSKWGHISIIILTSIDVSCIFANFILSLYICEHQRGREPSDRHKPQFVAQSVLEETSLIISCLFMAELIGSLWAFGPSYFKSWFHCLDATVILASFFLETALKNVFEGRIGSAIVVLRLWRVFQIIEELGASAKEHMVSLNARIEDLTAENHVLRDQVAILRSETGQ